MSTEKKVVLDGKCGETETAAIDSKGIRVDARLGNGVKNSLADPMEGHNQHTGIATKPLENGCDTTGRQVHAATNVGNPTQESTPVAKLAPPSARAPQIKPNLATLPTKMNQSIPTLAPQPPAPSAANAIAPTKAMPANPQGMIKSQGQQPIQPKIVGTRVQDNSCINALLSLGRDLHGSGGATNGQQAVPQVIPILPRTADTIDHRKKRQKLEGVVHPQTNERPNLPDFWYYLPLGEKVGDWDVLCGRGGESNNYIGNKKYRRIVNERKEAYRTIPQKQRKAKTAFVKSIVDYVNNCGGRFVDTDESSGRYYVVTMEKARKKTSQALRETKELKWLETEPKEKKSPSNKNSVCPYCSLPGHKTKIARACKLHHEWVDANITKPVGSTEESKLENGDSGGHDRKDKKINLEDEAPMASEPAEARNGQLLDSSTGATENTLEPPSQHVPNTQDTCNGDAKPGGTEIVTGLTSVTV